MTEEKIKIFTISDMPLSPSGVGTQTRYVIEGLLKTGKYKFVSLGGAIKHQQYQPIKTEEWGDDWVIYPVDGFGSPDVIRSIIRNEKPALLWFMTDPRFYEWLWKIEDEIRPLMPMVYYHVWDNYPYPVFNRKFYLSNDFIATISKVTDDFVKTVAPEVEREYVPHAVDSEVFKRITDEEMSHYKKKHFGDDKDKVTFFWNNRNARRKMSGSLVWWFKEFLDQVGHDKARLIMHTDPKDPNGPDLEAYVHELGLLKGEIMFSKAKVQPQDLAVMYNIADCVINISDAEGFGLATLEALSCETPIIVSMTGGLQEQVTDGKDWFGVGIEPSSKAVIGSQQVPFIYEDRISKEDFLAAMLKIYNMTDKQRHKLGKKGRAYVEKNYNFENFHKSWERIIADVIEKHGSWNTRKGHKAWTLKEAA